MFSHLFKLRDYLVHERKVVTNMAIASRQNRWIVLGSQIKTFANYSDWYNIIERRPSIGVRQGLTQRGKPTERHSTHWPHVYIAHQSSVPSPPSYFRSLSVACLSVWFRCIRICIVACVMRPRFVGWSIDDRLRRNWIMRLTDLGTIEHNSGWNLGVNWAQAWKIGTKWPE